MTDHRVELEKTIDGSYTLYVPDLNEHYHSTNGAIQESKHVFIEAGLKSIPKKDISILEVGLGTGLNAYLTLLHSQACNYKINYWGCELYPLSEDVIQSLNYPDLLGENRDLFDKIHTAPWGDKIEFISDFHLKKVQGDLTELNILSDNYFDLIYYDAFAPDKQSEMWTQEIFDYLYVHTSNNGILVTYCAKGIVRRMLQAAGYKVERLPGPPGKREMLRAQKK